jgi:hypothetical protein
MNLSQAASAVAGRVEHVRSLSLTRSAKFCQTAPSAQTALDAVPDRWVSRFPPPLADLAAGSAQLFDDARMTWAFERLGGLEGLRVLDLGPLEGAHSYMAQAAGAEQVIGVEANANCFLKCLVTKEILGLDRCSFLCGDVTEYLATVDEKFDVCFACGLLYHMVDPVRLLDLISRRATRIVIWTHVYDPAVLAHRHVAKRLGPQKPAQYGSFRYHVHRHAYGLDKRLVGYCGGTLPHSNWLPREDLLAAVAYFGWQDIEISFEDLSNVNGPALALVARRDEPLSGPPATIAPADAAA